MTGIVKHGPRRGLFPTVLSCCLFPTLVVLVLFDLRLGISGRPEPISARLVGFGLLALIGAPVLWSRRHEVTRTGRWLIGSFSLLLLQGLVSALVAPRPLVQKVLVERTYMVVPMVEAAVTMLAAWGLVLATPTHRRRQWVWWGAVVLLGASLLEWPRMAVAQASPRLATGMGGASTVHQAFLLAGGVLMAGRLAGWRRRAGLVGVVIAGVMVVATGSRAGLASLVLAGFLGVLWAARSGVGRRALGIGLTALCLMAVTVACVPSLRRLVVLGDELRATNLQTAWRVFTSSWHGMVLGAGEGRVWPWLAFETGRLKILWRGRVTTQFGDQLTSAHSTVAAVAVELGLVGLGILCVFFTVQLVRGVREWGRVTRGEGDTSALVIALVLLAALPANLLDTYLVKNFGVAFWWWVVTAVFLGTTRAEDDRDMGLSRPDGRPAPGPRGAHVASTSARP